MSLVLLSPQFVVNGVVLSQYLEEMVVDTHLCPVPDGWSSGCLQAPAS